MKRLFLFSLFYCCFLCGNSQNLVRNPGFDSSFYCPIGLGDLSATIFWFNPTSNSPDYFHLCNTGLAPNNTPGWQMPSSDSAYIGLSIFTSGSPNGREYAEGSLLQPLINGRKYCFSMRISLCDNCQAAAGPIGVYFSDTLVYMPYDSLQNQFLFNLPLIPQLEFPSITDTSNWILVQDTFIASGNEIYFVIGNFRSAFNIQIDTINPPVIGIGSYYYIDDVSITFCDTIQPPPPVEPISAITAYNAFSPNGDGVNDVFTVTYKDIKTYRLQIFNRWGNLIFETDDAAQGWDGRYNGGEVPEGTYYYLIDATGLDEERYLLKGFVMLVR